MDFTTFEDFNYLFEDDPSQNGIQNYFYAVVDEFWNTLDHEAYHYVVSGLSVSLTSQSNQFEAAIADLIDYDWIFTQSAANTNSPGNAFGDTLPNVITVGAYNTDSSGYWLGSNYDDYLEIDLYADGYVENPEWDDGWNFGTSFATPVVAAEINNLFIELSNEVDLSDTETVDLTDNQYAEISERMIYEISDAVDIYFSDIEEPFRVNVLSDTLDGLDWEYLQPISIPFSLPDSNIIFRKSRVSQSISN